MKNKNNGDRFLFVKNGETYPELILIQWSTQGGATAFHGFSDTVLGHATGYGYDKESDVLAQAIAKLTGDAIQGHGVGLEAVKRSAAEYGHIVYLWHDILGLVIKQHTRSNTYAVASKALRVNASKARDIAYGNAEAVAMANFVDSRMNSGGIIDCLSEIN